VLLVRAYQGRARSFSVPASGRPGAANAVVRGPGLAARGRCLQECSLGGGPVVTRAAWGGVRGAGAAKVLR